jgi:hypothetical protein
MDLLANLPRNLDLIPGGDKGFFFSLQPSDRLWDSLVLYSGVPGALSSAVKWPPSSAKVNL